MKRLSWFVLFSILAISCLDTPDCYQLNNNYLGVVFKIIGGGTDRVYLASITNPEADTALLKKATLTSAVSFTLDPYSNEGSYSFDGYYAPVDGTIPILPLKKTLNLSYLARVQFVSEDCGERHVFTEVSVPSSDFDTTRIVNPTPANPATTNIELMRCPNTNLVYLDFVSDIYVKTISVKEINTVLLNGIDTISSILLPLLPQSGTTTFDFVYADNTKRTLVLNYERTTKNRFEECGEQTFINRIETGRLPPESVAFSNVTVLEDSIHDLPKVNLEITP